MLTDCHIPSGGALSFVDDSLSSRAGADSDSKCDSGSSLVPHLS